MARPLLLSGFMATGKSAVGRAVAERSGAHFIDLDEVIEEQLGGSIAKCFEEQGESEFRRLEQQALRRLLDDSSSSRTVIALGGGALVDRGVRLDVLGSAVVVTLSAGVDEILRRVEQQDGDSGARPLLAGSDPKARIEALLAARKSTYAESHASVPTTGRSVDEIAAEVIRIWEEDAICVAAGSETYRVLVGSGLIGPRLAELVGTPSGLLLVTDENVKPLHGDKAGRGLSALSVRQAEVVLTPGEEHKNLEGLSRIYQAAFDAGLDRSSTFVGLGGGVVTDMTGFAAATWVRGVRWVGAPTTLLSMVDASVGGKTAVDFQTAKNSVGAFWQPAGVICDVDTLLTETDRMYLGAMSEIVKTAIIGDPELFSFLEDNVDSLKQRDLDAVAHVVDRCVRVKARVVALDEREAGIRATLNLGHTVGHALEASSGYTGLTHGEAVSLGMVAAMRWGKIKGHTSAAVANRVIGLLQRLGLPHHLSKQQLESSVDLLSHDKKRAGNAIRFVYARGVGDVFTESVGLDELSRGAPTLAD